ncbi:monocarboxylate transporter 4 isoform X1 [Lynx canadensis]|uniref:Solute carrier family 16 member 3 n=1 Tax=Lynx canadensis TaxID=61383 RepID=A0A667IEZ2_LYNCA|nr:monocarboxylate transporter 4 isoform X1 [Lynx canadensis]
MGRAQGGPFLPPIRGSPWGQTQHRPSLCKTCPTTGRTCTVRGCTWSQRTRLWNGPLRTVGSRRLNRANRKETDPGAFCCKPCLAWEGVWARLTSRAPGLSAELGQGAPGGESPGPALCPPPPGPLCSVCVNRFGCRPVMLAGGLLASLGMVAASFCGSVIQLYLTTGVITGLGLALNFQPSLIMLNRYFNKRRPMANGLAAAGSPVFLCALSPLGQLLQDHYGWRGGFLILGGLLLNCCVCAALMRPLEASRPGSGPGPQRPARRLLDLSVFRDRGFVIYAVAASIMVLGLFVPPVFVVSYAKDLGVPDTQAAFLLTVLGFIDIFARPAAGFITGLKKVRPYSVYLFSFSMFFNGFTDLTGSTASDYGGLVVFCIFFGISYGMVGALQFEVLMAIVGTQKFSSAIGLVLLLEAIAVLIGPPSGGKLLDATHVYQYVFLLAGAEVLASSLVLVLGNFFCIKKRPEAAVEEGERHKPPADVRVDSREVEHFLKAEPEKNGEVVHTPETSV